MQNININSIQNNKLLEKELEITRKAFMLSLLPSVEDDQVEFLLFRPINLHTLTMLNERSLWFSHPSTFNDPFDSSRAKKIYKGEVDCSQMLKELRVRSLSTNNPQNMLLWAHYADGHRGIAIKIQLNKSILNKHNVILRKISYNHINIKKGNGDFKIITEELYLTKEPIWKYEEEYRLITLSKYLIKEHLLVSSPECSFFKIKQIIFGLKTTQENKSIIKKLLPKVPCIDITEEELKKFANILR